MNENKKKNKIRILHLSLILYFVKKFNYMYLSYTKIISVGIFRNMLLTIITYYYNCATIIVVIDVWYQ